MWYLNIDGANIRKCPETAGWKILAGHPKNVKEILAKLNLSSPNIVPKKLAQQYVRHNILCMLRDSDIAILNNMEHVKYSLWPPKSIFF